MQPFPDPDPWATSMAAAEAAVLFARLRAAGLPLLESESDDDGAGSGVIVALVTLSDELLSATIATSSGLLYRVPPQTVEAQRFWWSFAARNYYIVTGNMADRRRFAQLTGCNVETMVGRTWSLKKQAELSGLGAQELFDRVAPPMAASATISAPSHLVVQSSLF